MSHRSQTISGWSENETRAMTNRIWGWSEFFDSLSSFLTATCRQYGSANRRYCEYVVERFEVYIRSTVHIRDSIQGGVRSMVPSDPDRTSLQEWMQSLNELITSLRRLASSWDACLERFDQVSVTPFQVSLLRPDGRRGRPCFDVRREQLEYLNSLCFNWTQIASIIGVSRMTIYRRRVEFGMLNIPVTRLSNAELLCLVEELRREHPHAGEVVIMGEVRSRGYRVPRARLRHAIHESDPLNTPLRWRGGLTARRPYSVPEPNSLWHIGMSMYVYRGQTFMNSGLQLRF